MGIDPSGKFTFMEALSYIRIEYVLALAAIPMIGCSGDCTPLNTTEDKLLPGTDLDIAGKIAVQESIGKPNEHGGYIYKKGKCYFRAKKFDGEGSSLQIAYSSYLDEADEISASWHTHGNIREFGSEWFSSSIIQSSCKNSGCEQLPNGGDEERNRERDSKYKTKAHYLGTPGGAIRKWENGNHVTLQPGAYEDDLKWLCTNVGVCYEK